MTDEHFISGLRHLVRNDPKQSHPGDSRLDAESEPKGFVRNAERVILAVDTSQRASHFISLSRICDTPMGSTV